MIDETKISNALYDIFLQARNGKIEIDSLDNIPYTYNVRFMVSSIDIRLNTLVDTNESAPTLHVDNIDTLVNALIPKVEYYYKIYKEDYPDLDEYNMIKMICSSFFFNMTYLDFLNPVAYISKLPESKPVEDQFKINMQGNEYTIDVIHRTNALNLETIDTMKIVLSNNKTIHNLPAINYQIIGDKAIIKSIQAHKDSDSSKYITASGLPHVAGASNKHLRNISPATLLSLTIAIKTLKEQANVKEISFPTIMPIRYNALVETLTKKEVFKRRREKQTDIDIDTIYEDSIAKADSIQFNITNKLINTISRFIYHFDNYDFTDHGDNSFMVTIKEKEKASYKDDILHDIFFAESTLKRTR